MTSSLDTQTITADKAHNVLFICTGNSTRSILAQGLMNHPGGGRFIKAYSAGGHPAGTLNPFALQTVSSLGIPADGFRSKSWDEFTAPGSPVMDFVFTVCDKAAGELCPVWPAQPMTAHWGAPDPAAVEGSDELKARSFMEVSVTLKRRIELMLALPLDKLEPLAISHQITDVGTR